MADNSGVSQTGLELLLEFEDNLNDSSSNGRDQSSTLQEPVYIDGGAVNKGAQFYTAAGNEIDTDLNTIGSATLFAGAGDAWTVAAWVKDLPGKGCTLCERRRLTVQPTGFTFYGRFLFTFWVGSGGIGVFLRGAYNAFAVEFDDANWHHVAVTWDGSSAFLYVDGEIQPDALDVGSLNDDALATIYLCGTPLTEQDKTRPWDDQVRVSYQGGADDYRIYSRALSAGEIDLLYSYGDDIEDTGSGSAVSGGLELLLEGEDDLTDGSVNGRDQTGNVVDKDGATVAEPSYVTGKVGDKAIRWVGDRCIETGVADMGAASLFATAGEPFSVSAWVRFDGTDTGQMLVSRGDVFGSTHDFRINMRPQAGGGAEFRVDIRGQVNIYSTPDLADGDWHFIVVTWDGSNGAVYYDNSAQSAPVIGAGAEDGGNIVISGQRDTNSATDDYTGLFDGDVDDFRIYSTALSADDVDELFTNDFNKFSTTLELLSLTSGSVGTVQVTFGKDIDASTFTLGDISVTNGTAGDLTEVTATSVYTFTVTPTTDGTVTVSIAADTVSNDVGVTNLASGDLSWGVSVSSDGLRLFDRSASQASLTANIQIGPIAISPSAARKARIERSQCILGRNTDATGTVSFSCGTDGEDAVDRVEADDAQYTVTIATLLANNGVSVPRVSGHALVLEIDTTSGHLTFEQNTLESVDLGLNQLNRHSA